MEISQDDPRLVFMPFDQVAAAKGFCNVVRDRWFVVHPERGLLFFQTDKRRIGKLLGAAAQCNANKQIATRIRDKMYPWAEVRQFALVMEPIAAGDFQ
jgi:hypothetical protein